MAEYRENILFAVRLLAILLALSCISPVPDTSSRRAAVVPAQLSSIAGDLRIVITKSQYALTLFKGETPLKTYRAVFGKSHQDGDKRMMGDKRTPEGDFYICTMNQSKRFYKFLGLSYPGIKHAESGLQSNLISSTEYQKIKKAIADRQPPPWETRLGGAVGIHGRIRSRSAVPPLDEPGANWTDGCIALDNADVDEIYAVVALGTPVTILP